MSKLIEQSDSISAESPQKDATGANVRPWYRLHASTSLVLLLVLTALALLNVPARLETHSLGKPDPNNILDFGLGSHFEHGWPWTFLTRHSINNSQSIISGHGTSVWWMHERVDSFSPWLLLSDVAVCGILAAAVLSILERRRRRRAHLWQFSIGDLFVAIAIFASALGFVVWQYREYQREWQAIEALIGNDGAEQNANTGGFRITGDGLIVWRSGLPRWITERLAVLPYSFFDRVVYVAIGPREPADFRQLASFSEIEAINLLHGGVWSNEVQVERGYLSSGQSDGKFTRAMCQLNDLSRLRVLHLADSHVSDAALAVIAGFPAIEMLDLGGERGVRIGEAGLRHISRMKKLRFLYLKDPNRWFLRDSTVRLIANIPTLEALWLSSVDVTDRALEHLATLTNLRELNLAGTEITGDTLPVLKQLPNLQRLVVPEAVDAAARKSLIAMPGLTVTTK
jgi:hypothetical protein